MALPWLCINYKKSQIKWLIFFFWDRVSLCCFGASPGTSSCRPGWPRTHLPLPPEGWVKRHAPPLPSSTQYFLKVILFMWEFSCIYACAPWKPGIHRSQKMVLGTLELGLQTVVAAMWVLGIKPRSSSRAVSALKHWAISAAHIQYFNPCFVYLDLPSIA